MAEKAYLNDEFLNSSDARPLRLLAEYLEPLERFEDHNIKDTVLIFGSARLISREAAEQGLEEAKKSGGDIAAAERALRTSRYYEETRELSYRLTKWSKSLSESECRFVVCSGGGPGIMEAANRGASEAKGENIGLGISLPFEQSNNPYITRKLDFQFHYFFMRKFWFLYTAKAVVVMPGGFGSFDELFESLTLVQCGKIKKHLPIVLYGDEFWKKAVNFEALVEFGTISPEDVNLFHSSDSVDDAFDYITAQLAEHSIDCPGLSL
ncbi:MAG: lysine decarboxylase [Alphaproteobacteria bacterium]|nr:lysine decarboxylase [Alphaproteobacteria bacterium]